MENRTSDQIELQLMNIFRRLRKIKPEDIRVGHILVPATGFRPVGPKSAPSLIFVMRRSSLRAWSRFSEINLRHDFRVISDKKAQEVERLIEEYEDLKDREIVAENMKRAEREKEALRDHDVYALWNDIGNGFVIEIFNGRGKLLDRTRLVDDEQEEVGGKGNDWDETERMARAYAASFWQREWIKRGSQYIVIQVEGMD